MLAVEVARDGGQSEQRKQRKHDKAFHAFIVTPTEQSLQAHMDNTFVLTEAERAVIREMTTAMRDLQANLQGALIMAARTRGIAGKFRLSDDGTALIPQNE